MKKKMGAIELLFTSHKSRQVTNYESRNIVSNRNCQELKFDVTL